MDELSYGRSGRRNTLSSNLLELLQRIRGSVGDEVFGDALALISATPPHHPGGPGGAGEGIPWIGRTKLPHNFICAHQHTHSVTSLASLLGKHQPRCLLERILIEWAALDANDA